MMERKTKERKNNAKNAGPAPNSVGCFLLQVNAMKRSGNNES
jgi:hypothetical protein